MFFLINVFFVFLLFFILNLVKYLIFFLGVKGFLKDLRVVNRLFFF